YAFNYGLEHRVSYRTTMNNFEVNGRISPRGEPDRLVMQPDGRWRRECQPGTYMSYLYGIRYLRDNETFKLHTVSQYNATSSETIDGVGEYDTLTYNNLVGLQVGADVMFRQCRWAWGFTTKAGPFINFASQESTITATTSGDSNDTVYERFVANRYKAAFVGEMGVQATYKFRPNLVGRASYDLMWITGLALAPEQLQFAASPVAKINTNGLVFSQGVSLGLEWLW
ncbi:MAG: BBP7 family outer membrane beta-barrel protein, partial [Thermoguttaceae bacterium]